jgi:hypothetical protein
MGFAAFLTVLAATLVPLGIPASFALAGSVVVVVQLVELRAALRPRPREDAPEAPADTLLVEAAD